MKKISIILTTILFCFICLTTVVFATNKMDLNINQTSLNLGDELTATINFDIEEGSSLYSYTARLNYDKDVFEIIEKENFEDQENWADIKYSSYDNKFELTSKDEENSNKVINIKLKVKEDANLGETTITLDSGSVFNSENTINLEDASQKINIIGNEENQAIQSETSENKNQFPWLILILAILCLAIILIIVKVLPNLRLTKMEKNVITVIAIILIILLLIVIFEKIFNKSSDVNTYFGTSFKEDSKKTARYILEIKNPSNELPNTEEENNNNNNNEDITTEDKIENSTSYQTNSGKVNSSNNGNSNNSNNNNNSNSNNSNNNNNNSSSNNDNNDNNNNNNNNNDDNNHNNGEETPAEKYGFEKKNMILSEKVSSNDELILSFENATESKYAVKSVIIDGVEYQVHNENGKYTVKLPKGTKGIKNSVNVEKVILENGYEQEINEKFEYIYLKDKPTIEKINVEQDNTNLKVNLDIKDNDLAIKDITIYLIDENGNIISEQKSSEGGNLFEVSKSGAYKIKVKTTYDLGDGIESSIEQATQDTYTVQVKTKASITKAEVQNYYVKKGENVEIKYTFESSNNESKPKGVNINNTFYPATENNDGTYTVFIPAESSGYGIKKHIAEIAMFGEETVILENTEDAIYYLLKDEPSIEYTFNEFVKNQSLEFTLKNSENAIIKDAKVILTNNANEEVLSMPLNEETIIELNKIPNGVYTLSLYGTYDLDDDENNNQNTHNLSEIFESREIQITSTYTANLTINNVEVKEESAIITFTSTNSSDADVEYVIVDGEKYKVTKQENTNTYTVEVPHKNEENAIKKITAVIIRNDIDINLEQEQTYEVFKAKPTVKDITAEQDGDNLNVNFTFEDVSSIAKNAKVVVKKDNNVIQSKEIETKDTNIVFENITQAGTYTIEFLADYDRADGKEHNQEKINETDVTFTVSLTAKVELLKDSLNEYYDKDSEVILTYHITLNTEEPITSIRIDETNYNQENFEISNGNYVIKVIAPNKAGEKTYNLEEIKCGDKSVTINNTEAKIFVLKAKPSITNFVLDRKAKTITFNLNNPDSARIDGKVMLKSLDGTEVYQYPENLKNGKNIIDLTKLNGMNETTTYEVVLDGIYDLDDNKNGKNEYSLSDFIKEEIQLKIVTDIAFDSFSTRYPEKGKDIEITFNITSNTKIPVSEIYVNYKPYQATLVSDNKYKITYTAKKTSGIENLTVTEVKHGIEEVEIKEPKSEIIEVLRSKPKVPFNYEINNNYDEKTVTFKFTLEDSENVLENGKAYVSLANGKFKDTNGQTNIPVQVGYNEITFVDVEEGRGLPLCVSANYDLDTNILNDILQRNDNKYENSTLLKVIVFLLPPSVLDVNNITALDPTTGESSIYLNKNSEFKLSFTSETYIGSLDGQKISYYPVSAIINGKKYELDKNGNTYTTKETLSGYIKSGKQTITIDSVTLNNHEVVEEDIIGTLEVLKDKLSVESLAINTESKKAILTYNLIDLDNSFVSGLVKFTNVENNTETTLEVNNKENSYELNLEPYKIYSVILEMTYDLDEDKQNTEHQDKITYGPIETELVPEYNLKIENAKITSMNNEEHKVTIEFTSTNNSHSKIKTVKVGDTDYVVTPLEPAEDNKYAFEYPYGEELENKRTEIKISDVLLGNNVRVTPSQNDSVIIFKNKPEVTSIDGKVENVTNINAEFEIKDDDATLTKLYAVLKDQNGNELQSKDLNVNDRKVTFEGVSAGKYIVEILADYNLVDGKENIKVSLKESSLIEVEAIATIKTNSISNKFPAKGDTITLDYNITSNTNSPISSVMINGTEYPVTKYSEGNYKISYTVPTNFGPHSIDLTMVNFENKLSAEIEGGYKEQVDILKSAPTITNFATTEKLESGTVVFTFKINDPDGAFVSGKANVDEDVREITKDMADDTITLIFNVKLDELKTFKVEINYNLDSDSTDIYNSDVLLFEQQFSLVYDYNLTLKNEQTYKEGENTPTKYFAQNEPIQLRFNCENKIGIKTTQIKIKDVNDKTTDGKWYDVTAVENADGTVNYYYAILDSKDKPGLEELEIVEIMLSTGKTISKDDFAEKPSNITVDILKNIPEITDFTTTNNQANFTISFNVIDKDDALLDSYIKVVNKENNEDIALNEKITKGKNTHNVTLKEDIPYTLTIERNYNLDSQKDDDQNIKYEVIITKDLEIAGSNFKIKNLSLPKRIPNGSTAVMTFENELMSYQDVEEIKIDNEYHDVTKDPKTGEYSLTLTPEKVGINTIYLENVKMGGKTFDIDRYVSYIHEKAQPEAYEVTDIQEDKTENVAKISYKLKDPDKTIKTLTAIMKNSAGAVATTKVLEDPTTTSFDMPLLKTFRYTIELKAEYDVGDGKTFDTKTLFEQTKETEGFVSLLEENINTKYVTKGEEVTLIYKIFTNVDQEVKKIFIDDISYNVEKEKDEKGNIVEDTYRVTMKAPEDSGIFEQHVTRMQIGTNTYPVDDKNPVKIRVLKDKPTLTHFIIDENANTLYFKINDKDKSLTKAPTFTITNNKTSNKNTQNLKNTESEYTFNLKTLGINQINEEYHVIVNASYDLKPQEDKANKAQEESTEPEIETEGTEDIFERDIKLSGKIDYNFKFTNFKNMSEFTVSMPQRVEFDCYNSSDYAVAKVIIDDEEYPVYKVESRDSDCRYGFMYKAKSYDQVSFQYKKIILENGASYDVSDDPNSYTYLWMVYAGPTIEITELEENISNKKMTFKYKVNDTDKTLNGVEDPIFILKDSNGKEITRKDISVENNSVEFDIPNPPSSSYQVEIRAPRVLRAQDLYEKNVQLGTGEFESSVNTSILSAKFETLYPKKGETIIIDYTISSTKVILVDPEDHANLSKAVNISSLVVNGSEYTTEYLGNYVYRIYYTAKNTAGIENINVSQINFSNNTTEIFDRTDKVEVLKALPKITNYKTENNILDGTVTFTFNLEDEDSILTSGSIRAVVGDQSESIKLGENKKTFKATTDILSKFEIRGTFDLDEDILNSETGEDQNRYEDDVIFTKPFMLTGSYDIEFNNITTYNSKLEKTKYFEKNEDIKVEFEFSAKEGLELDQINVNGENYIPEQDAENKTKYSITIKGTDKSGPVNASITSVTLNSGNNVNLVDKNISYEVLKDIIKVESFNYSVTEEDADDIKLEINVSDKDNSNKQIRLEIKDEYGKPINVINPNLNLGDNTVIFEKTNAAKYFVSIYADYERDENDTDTENSYKNIRVYYEVVTIDTRYIEMKDIIDVQLYRFSDTTGSVERVYSLTERNLKVLDNCIVKVTMRDITPFFAEINSYDIKDGKLTLMLDYDDAMIYTGKDLKKLEVTLDILTDQSYEYKGSFKALAEKIKENPKAEITLDKDYDLADYPGNLDDSEAIIDKFEGTLNGNGHVISNLHKPLFNTITNGKIQNIKFNNITFSKKNQRAVVVKTGSGAQITNVHIDGVAFVDGSCGDNNSAFAYELKENSIVQNSSAININFTPGYLGQANAGGVSNMYNSTIKNCYVEGRITSGWHFNGGLVGRAHNNSQIINNIVNMYVTPYYGLTSSESSGNGGIVGSSNATDVVLKNNLSLIDSTDKISTIYNPKNGNTISDSSENNYQLEDTVATKQTHKGIKSVKKSDINDKLFETMKFDKSIWNITEETSFENLPTLKGNTVAFLDKGAKPNYSETYIPDYSRISNSTDYDKEREIIYHNMYKLMPFYDAKEILTDGNKISKTHKLNQKFIKYVLAYDDNGKLVSSLNTKNYNSLRKISIVFEDGDELEYSIDFDDYYGNVVSYIVSELNIGYNYNRFVIHEDLDIVKKLVDEASKYDFTRDLDPLTKDEDSRLYKEYFDNATKHHITEFVETILTNSEYVPTFENEVLNNLIIQNLIDTGKLKELLFAYNYFKYWYSLDMDNVDVADSIMFHGSEMFSKGMTLSNISSELVKGSNSATNVTGNFYRNYLSQYTKLSNLGEFLNYYVTTLTKFNSGNDWFKANWHGGIYIDIDINRPNVYYTIWDHVIRSSNVQNSFLPLFTVPENSMYVITSPTQTFYGSLRIYMQNPNDPAQLEKFKDNELAQFTRQVRNFYTFAYDFVGAEYLNPFVDVQYDMRTTLTDKGTKYNNPKTTTENYHKYFAEAINKWPASNGSGAYANGFEVYWNVIKLISGFNVSTHESLHNQDSKVFLKGYGRRGKDGNSEDYTAGNLQQYYNEGWVSPNIMEEELSAKSLGHPITQNYRLDRVNTNAKLQDFYDKYFRLNDMLDYIEAKAFLTLTNQEKANVAAQVSYPRLANKSKEEQDKGDSHVQYDPLTLDKVNQMKLNDVADLWDNKIMLRPGLKETQIFSPGAATDSLYNIRWYQPHADDDRPDGANFKWLAWEMAGNGGYYDGYMAYYSQNYIDKNTDNKGQKTTDLIALKYITGKDSFKQYKLDRYDYAKKHYGDKDTYINAEEIFKEYVEALKKDAKDPKRPLSYSTAVKRKYFIGIKEETNDLEIDPFSKKTTTSSINNENLTTKLETKTNNVKTEIVDKNTNITTNSTNITNTTNTSNTTNTVAENSVSTSTNTLAKPNENKKENVVSNTIETTE